MRNKINIYDCSNSLHRPPHRGGGGPLDNDIIRYLKENAHRFGAEFVSRLDQAAVALTNDVFPPDIVNSSIPKVKRMDGTFFTENLIERNTLLNQAATTADHVIFISEFSQQSSIQLYNLPLKQHSVILNVADPQVFYPNCVRSEQCRTLVAAATDWSRPEKRLNATLQIAKLAPEWIIFLIGISPANWYPTNVVALGYIHDPVRIATILRSCDAMISMSYKDPCPKTVCQGVSCGLPILWTDSGGHGEIVQCGVSIRDIEDIQFELASPPPLDDDLISYAIKDLNQNFQLITSQARMYDPGKFDRMLESYFSVIRSVV